MTYNGCVQTVYITVYKAPLLGAFYVVNQQLRYLASPRGVFFRGPETRETPVHQPFRAVRLCTKLCTFAMKIKYLTRRHNVYWFQRRVPKDLEDVMQTTGVYRQNLRTTDPKTAMSLVDAINRAWEVKRVNGSDSPRDVFRKALERLDPEGESPDWWLNVEDADDFARLSPNDKAEWQASQVKKRGAPVPMEFQYSLQEALREWEKLREGEIKPKTLVEYGKSVRAFLGVREDIPLALIDRAMVKEWLDDSRPTSSYATRDKHRRFLAQIWADAVDRGIETTGVNPDARNPFKDHRHGSSKESNSYEYMSDAELEQILEHLNEEDRGIARIARSTGMRQAEIFKSPIEVHEDILCFAIKDAKTAAGVRLVPVPDALHNEIQDILDPTIKNNAWTAKDYSKRFGRAKRKAGITARSKSFHSLRATFITEAGRSGYQEQQVAWLVGHEDGKGTAMTGSLYFKGYSVHLMKEIIEAASQPRH